MFWGIVACIASLVACRRPDEVAAPVREDGVAQAPAPPADAAAPDAPPVTPLATLRREIAEHVVRAPKHRLSKAELRPRMKTVMRALDPCYRAALAKDARISGVVNTRLAIRNDPARGISLTVTGFDTHGPLGASHEFLACVTATLESNVLPALPTTGSIDVTYPLTFDPDGVRRHDSLVDDSVRAAKQGRCTEAVEAAERGLGRSWLAGTLRHTLIEVAGTCACRLKDERKARHYFSLASPEFEDAIVRACSGAGIALVE